jgi:hypothetical protein
MRCGEKINKLTHPQAYKKNTVLWDMTPCILIDGYELFGGRGCLNFEARRMRQYVPPKRW